MILYSKLPQWFIIILSIVAGAISVTLPHLRTTQVPANELKRISLQPEVSFLCALISSFFPPMIPTLTTEDQHTCAFVLCITICYDCICIEGRRTNTCRIDSLYCRFKIEPRGIILRVQDPIVNQRVTLYYMFMLIALLNIVVNCHI